MIPKTSLLVLGLLSAYPTPSAHARSIPPNLQSFYNIVKTTPCSHPIKNGFEDGHGNPGFSYCGDYNGMIYISGPKSQRLADMDIDCDGSDNMAGKCSDDPSGQAQTSFKTTAKSYGVPDLNSSIHSYVVFGNEGGSPSFDPVKSGLEPLSVMAVVCDEKLFYGVWGDKNEGTYIGEASISLAKACFPDQIITGNTGYLGHDILYLGFTGKDAAPGQKGADWNAQSFSDFETSLSSIGDRLVATVSASPSQKPDFGSGSISSSGPVSSSNSDSDTKSGQERIGSWNGVCFSVLFTIFGIFDI